MDLPGYGYAKVSKAEQEKWSAMIDTYLSKRYNLVQVIQLVDADMHRQKMILQWRIG